MLRTLIGAMAVLLASCASDGYQTTVNPEELEALTHETVAARPQTVSGVDIWTTGVPGRKFKILGLIRDHRRNLDWRMKTYYQDIAAITKRAGGDAAIIVLADSRTVVNSEDCVSGMLPPSACGDAGSGASFSPEAPGQESTVYSENRESNQAPLEFRYSHILVVKYLQ